MNESVIANDRDEWRSAARHDPNHYRRISGVPRDEADVPDEEDR